MFESYLIETDTFKSVSILPYESFLSKGIIIIDIWKYLQRPFGIKNYNIFLQFYKYQFLQFISVKPSCMF